MTEKRYRVGLLGCGGIAHTHARSILKTGRMELVAFCDMAEHRAKEFNERYAQGSGQVFTNYQKNVRVGKVGHPLHLPSAFCPLKRGGIGSQSRRSHLH